MAKNKFHALLTAVNSNKSVKAIDLVKNDPEIAAVISKLVAPSVTPRYDNSGKREIEIPVFNNFNALSAGISERAKDADSVLQLFPDMELSAQILISSIISPKDMTGSEITFVLPDDIVFSEVSALLLAEYSSYFKKTYNINELLPKILRRVLFGTGSFPIAVIPESSLDALINSTTHSISRESLSDVITSDNKIKNVGILGNAEAKATVSSVKAVESFGRSVPNVSSTNSNIKVRGKALHILSFLTDPVRDFNTASESDAFAVKATNLVNVYDNPQFLKLNKLSTKLTESTVANALFKRNKFSFSSESSNGVNDVTMSSLIYKGRYSNAKPFQVIKTSDQTSRENIGAPLVLQLPSESVIPVFTPGNVEKHVGIFVLIDNEGNPITRYTNTDHFGDLQSRLNGINKSMSSMQMDRVSQAFNPTSGNVDVAMASKIYSDVIEADLLARLRNGVYGNNVTIGKNESVYQIMLARTLANQHTNILYIPEMLVTYFAQRYDEHGIGKSLMDDMRTLNSLRAITLFARVQASVKNSIGRTAVALKLDEDNPDPTKTIEMAMHEVNRTRQQALPLGLNSPADIADWTQKAGVEFTFSGHPGLPDTTIEFSEKNSNYVKPDQELEDMLRKQAIMTIGLSPETVDQAGNAEFATTIVTNNILFTKRVMQDQEILMPQVTDHTRKIAFNDGNLVAKLKTIVKENMDKIKSSLEVGTITEAIKNNEDQLCALVVSEFLSNVEASLPQPDSVTIESQLNAFESYEKAVDAAIKYQISNEIVPADFAGDAGQKADDIRNIVKAHFMREWCIKNNFLPELSNISADDNGTAKLNVIELQKNHIASLIRSGVNLLNSTRPIANAANNDLNKITDGNELEESNSPVEGSGEGSSEGSDFGGGDLGGDDFGLGGLGDMSPDDGMTDGLDAQASADDVPPEEDNIPAGQTDNPI